MKKLFLLLTALSLMSSAQTTQLQTKFCGYTAQSFGEFIAADSVLTATNYEFQLVNGSYNQTFINSSGYPYLTLYNISGMTYGTTFTVSVRWSADNQSTWSAYGSTCTITSPSTATTQLSSAYCAVTYTDWATVIHADLVSGCNNYKYQLVNSALSYTQTYAKTNNNFNFTQFTGLQNATTYTASVSVMLLGVWNPYGPACSITTPSAAPTTSILPTECGTTASTFTQIFHCSVVTGATGYQYKMENVGLGYSQIYQKTNNNFNMHQFSSLGGGLQHSTAYDVSVSVKFMGVWAPFGPTCQLTTPATGSKPAYPNPSNTHFTIDSPAIITDAYGKEVDRIEGGDFGHNYTRGVYYVKSGPDNYKLIKQ